MKKFKKAAMFMIVGCAMALAVGCANQSAQNAASTSEANDPAAQIKTISGEELEKLNSGKKKDDMLIIDVRSPEEYQEGHLPNAINIFIDEFEDRLGEIEDLKDTPIITYCNTGNKSGQAAEILAGNGFKDVTNAPGVKEYDYQLVKYEDVRGAFFETFIQQHKDDIVLVDVRPADQVEKEGMIEGAINIPLDEIENHLDQLPKDKSIALYCNTGTRSAEAAHKLENLGYDKVVNSIEGVKEYPFALVK